MTRILSMKDVREHDGRHGTRWIVIDGEVYDVTAFVKKHPGGPRMLQLAAGREATALFESYHPGPALDRARQVLARRADHVGTLAPEETVPYGDPTFFRTVQARVEAALRQQELAPSKWAWACALEGVVLVVLATIAWYFRAFHGSYLAAVVAGILMARCGFMMHCGNHAAVARSGGSRAVGKLMEFIGASSIIWNYAHNVSHHGTPNVHGEDNDAQIGAPLLRFHPGLPRHRWHRVQPLLLAIGMSFGMAKWVISDVSSLVARRIKNVTFHLSRRQLRLAMLYKLLYAVPQIVVPIVVLGPLHGLLTTFVFLAVASYYMELIFIVNHLQKDLVPPPDRHWAEQQVLATANWSSGSRWANFISGGLNHQIEHHLFPSMSIYLYPVIAPVVRDTCEEFGLPYRDYPGFGSALWQTTCYLHDLGRPTGTAAPKAVATEDETRVPVASHVDAA